MQSKQTRCALIAASLHGTARAAVSYSTLTRRSFYFSNFANGPERSTAGLHFVLNTRCLRKNHVYSAIECFHAIMIDAKHLYFTVGVSNTVLFFLREINRFLEFLEFMHIRESLVSRYSILEHFEQ